MTERLKKDIIKLVIFEVVIEGENVKIFATIPLPTKIHERELDKTDVPGTFNAGATLGPINQTKMERIYNKHKQSNNTPLKRKVVVALSGGVDSSVAAALLKDEGYDVIGVFMKCWSDTKDSAGVCTWREDYKDALEVAKKLGIKFRAVDFEKEYKKYVFADFLKEYEAGRTPNPDILCNKVIKFNALLHYMRALKGDWLATGHHVSKKTVKGLHKIIAGKDKQKDQSYFLAQLSQEQLAPVLFPIGKYTKAQVRAKARKYGLQTADKRSSRGICFIGQGDFQQFLQKYLPVKPGQIVDVHGTIVGKHKGLAYYTIGQRYGLGISAQSPTSLPYYVCGKDPERNLLIVDQGLNADSLLKKEALVEEPHWISGAAPRLPLTCKARIRYRQPLQTAKLTADNIVKFTKPQRAIAPGQAIAFYNGQELLGSAVIK